MYTQVTEILQFILSAILKTWPYLVVTIPLAVAVNLSGASRFIRRAFLAQPLIAILLATFVGAFSPFCSCSVVPMVATLLIGGVPLAPVMSFWVASPSMDPEIFFLSVGMLGWRLAVARVVATLVLSLSAGFITHFLIKRGWLGDNILRSYQPPRVLKLWDVVRASWRRITLSGAFLRAWYANHFPARTQLATAACCPAPVAISSQRESLPSGLMPVPVLSQSNQVSLPLNPGSECSSGSCSQAQTLPTDPLPEIKPADDIPFASRLLKETAKASLMVLQFMALAYLLEAVIQLYVPEAWITGLLGQQNAFNILTAALLGVPAYTSNLAALPLVSALLAQGMGPGAAIAFLIAGPTTTLPAMSAVWGLVSRRVFALYVAFSLVGAILLGYAAQVFLG